MPNVPALPPWLDQALPFDRGVLALETGRHAGRVIHRIDHGPRDARPIVLLHGNPTWSYLWRKVIPRLEGRRAIAPDLLGLGLSSKLPSPGHHTVTDHADAIVEVLEQLDVEDAILVIQDWGGPIGVTAAARANQRIAGLVILNTAVILPKTPRGTAFHRFARRPLISDFVFRVLGFPLRALHKAQGDPDSIRGDVARAYRWPLRRMKDRIAPLALARMVPDTLQHPSMEPMREGQAWVEGFTGPTAIVWGSRDPVLGRALDRHRQALPNADVTETEAGHFLQEEVPDAIGDAILKIDAALG